MGGGRSGAGWGRGEPRVPGATCGRKGRAALQVPPPPGLGTSQATLPPAGQPPGMVPREAPASAQRPPPDGPGAEDVPRRRQKRRSRQYQQFLAHKVLLQEQGQLSPLPAPAYQPPGQHPGAEAPWPAPAPPAGPPPSKCVAIDCEMVGTGPRGQVSELARCSVVSYHGDVLYDKYVRPEQPVVDFRTRWSGVAQHHLHQAIPFQEAQQEILKLLKGKVVVGHALHNDFQALKYVHPRSHTRDTTLVPTLLGQPGGPARPRASLKDLALQLLHKKIQVGQHGHSSVEDAATAMELYRLVETRWEQQAGGFYLQEPDSGPDLERFMEDQYWPEDLAPPPRGGAAGAPDGASEPQAPEGCAG